MPSPSQAIPWRRYLVGISGFVAVGVIIFILRGGFDGKGHLASSPNDPLSGSSIGDETLWSPQFVLRLQDRIILDRNQQTLHAVDEELLPAPRQLSRPQPVPASHVRTVAHVVAPEILAYRRALPDNGIPLRGFRAPLWEQSMHFWPALIETARCDRASLAAAAVIEQGLHRDGLLLNLARTLETLKPNSLTNPVKEVVETVRGLGFPVDLLSCFPPAPARAASPETLIAWMVEQLKTGQSLDSLKPKLQKIPFRFLPAFPNFQVATEGGELPLGMLRMQFGGGYREGIIPGGTLDLIRQMVKALPDVDFIISVPETVLSPFESICRNHMAVVRPSQLTLISEPLTLSAWAQDNGKAGIRTTEKGTGWATLVPRYSGKGEGRPTFLPGDTFLAEGLSVSGQEVRQSRLLYQGGNLLAVREPATGRRILLIGDAVVHHNTALGLSREQTLEAFRIEFGVDECRVLPAVSFHIDFDLSVRVQGDRIVAFVNDTLLGARLVVRTGAAALERQGLLSTAALEVVRGAVLQANDRELFETLAPVVYGHLNGQGQFPAALARHFKVAPEDAPTENLRCFLVALEVIGSQVLTGNATPRDSTMRDYLAALRRLLEAAALQVAEVRKFNWEIVSLPSMPDLTPSLNYLNGIHDSTRFLVPIYGGFYSDVDTAALQTLRQALGSHVTVIPFVSGESQRQHGAVHCAAAAYPRL